jgi:hypothetical protein
LVAFQPSQHSQYSGISDGVAKTIGAGIQVAGTLAATGITLGAASKAQKSQQKHEKEMAKEEAKLVKLQAAASAAQATSTQAEASVQSAGTSTTLYVVGGAVLVTLILSGTAFFIFRKPSRKNEEAD